MKVYLQATELTRRVGDKTLFQGISLGIGEGQRVGLIAQNGTGKTTLLNILAGVDEPDGGEVVLRSGIKVGYLSQTPSFPDGMTVMDACFWHACQDRNDTEEALDLEVRSKQILGKLKIGDTSRKMSVLSGGQVKRVALANVLLQNPDLLILDEPTNHLDLEMIEWLEGYLGRQCITLLMVTHDRYFLDRVCNVILEMDDQTLYTYRGNYAYYLEKRQERIDNARAEIARANNLYRTELEWMRSTPQARSHKARYREEAFYELEKKAKRHIEEDKLRLQVNSTYIGSKIFEAEYVSKSFPAGEGREELVILKDFYYNFSRYEKMGIVGNNGTGKSTFLKLLLGLVAPDSGRFVIGETVKFGYFSQEPMQVDENMKVIDAVRRVAEYVDLGGGKHLTAMQFLQHFMFTPLQQQNYIYKLSGGERRRLQLCTVLMQNPNFLILDEPDLAKRFSDTIKRVVIEMGDIMDVEAGVKPEERGKYGFSFADDNCCLLNEELYDFFGYPILKQVFDHCAPNPEDIRFQHSDSAMEHLLPVLAKLPMDANIAALCDAGEIERVVCDELAPAADAVEALLK